MLLGSSTEEGNEVGLSRGRHQTIILSGKKTSTNPVGRSSELPTAGTRELGSCTPGTIIYWLQSLQESSMTLDKVVLCQETWEGWLRAVCLQHCQQHGTQFIIPEWGSGQYITAAHAASCIPADIFVFKLPKIWTCSLRQVYHVHMQAEILMNIIHQKRNDLLILNAFLVGVRESELF